MKSSSQIKKIDKLQIQQIANEYPNFSFLRKLLLTSTRYKILNKEVYLLT